MKTVAGLAGAVVVVARAENAEVVRDLVVPLVPLLRLTRRHALPGSVLHEPVRHALAPGKVVPRRALALEVAVDGAPDEQIAADLREEVRIALLGLELTDGVDVERCGQEVHGDRHELPPERLLRHAVPIACRAEAARDVDDLLRAVSDAHFAQEPGRPRSLGVEAAVALRQPVHEDHEVHVVDPVAGFAPRDRPVEADPRDLLGREQDLRQMFGDGLAEREPHPTLFDRTLHRSPPSVGQTWPGAPSPSWNFKRYHKKTLLSTP